MKPDDKEAYLLEMRKAMETRLGKGNHVVMFVFLENGHVACVSGFRLTKVMSLMAQWLSHRFDEIRERIKYDA